MMRSSLLCGIGLLQASAALAEVTVSAVTGVREDLFQWNIAGDINGSNPNIISELTWDNMISPHAELGLRWQADEHAFAQLKLVSVETVSGDNQDSDYLLDNRQGEFLRSNGDGGGQLTDVEGAIGYRWRQTLRGRMYHLIAKLGYSLHNQNLEIENSHRTIDTLGVSGGVGHLSSGLNATYDAEWKGVWVGLEVLHRLEASSWLVGAEMLGFRLDYDAKADWVLRTDFQHPVSFAHWAKGYGWGGMGYARYQVSDSWAWQVGVDYRLFVAWPGVSRFYLSNGTTTDQQLNEAAWESFRITTGLDYRF